jgi:glycine hydroxymethyltransferase
MGMHLLYGGHLTHGWKTSFSSVYYKSVQYATDFNGWLDYDEIARMADIEKPKLIFCGATAYPRTIEFDKFAKIAKSIDAYLVADISHIAGLIVGGAHPTATNHADVIMTTTHKTLRGPRGAMILCDGEPSEPLKPAPEKSRKYLPTMIDRAVFPGLQGGPHDNQTAAIAVALGEAMKPEFEEYAHNVVRNCKALASVLMDNGFKLVTGGTDNHLILIDVSKDGLTGKQAEDALGRAGITVNKNSVPHDQNPPYKPSGIRLGTPFLTSRGMREQEMILIGGLITEALNNVNNHEKLDEIRSKVAAMCREFPVY